MIKAKKYNIADTNIALLGSEFEKKARVSASMHEEAWNVAGKETGIQIWRIEAFKVKPYPLNLYGQFYDGDSYIVLKTFKKPGKDEFNYDVHFWLGAYTSQDEAGTAAYKTVELDDRLGGIPIQHREVQEHESQLFLSYFPNGIHYLHGGVESAFHHVKPEEYKPRLLHIKGKRHIRVTQVELSRDSLNSGDVFILDEGLKLFQFNGSKSGAQERARGAKLAHAISEERKGLAKVIVLEETDTDSDAQAFWGYLGGQGHIKSAAEGGSDEESDQTELRERKLFRLSDSSGTLSITEIASGEIKRTLLDPNDVFILDSGEHIFVWIGRSSSPAEKKYSLKYAQDYITQHNRPAYLPISRILEGGENEVFQSFVI